MENISIKQVRNSRMVLNEVYFWTDTIKDWKHLLVKDEYKQFIIEQLQWLVNRSKIRVYGFVIMPNHIHLIWEMIEMNGKEMPHASFNKWTSKKFLDDLRIRKEKVLEDFIEKTSERSHRFWQRDPLAVHLNSKQKMEQKLEYLHLNPLHERWNLATLPEDYKWSSANFYHAGNNDWGFLTHYQERF